jgi:hypothetical protein
MLADGSGQLSRTTRVPPAKPQPRRSVLPPQPRRSARIRKVGTSLPGCFFSARRQIWIWILPFLSPSSPVTFWLGSWGFFHASREGRKNECKNAFSSRVFCLLPFSSPSSRRTSPSTDEEPTTPSISKNNFLLASFFFFFLTKSFVRSIDQSTNLLSLPLLQIQSKTPTAPPAPAKTKAAPGPRTKAAGFILVPSSLSVIFV